MARLTAAKRKSMPAKEFGLPGKKAYPMPDASHAANAKSRASQAVNSGRMSKSTEVKIDAKADKVMGKRGNGPGGEVRHPQSHDEFEAL